MLKQGLQFHLWPLLTLILLSNLLTYLNFLSSMTGMTVSTKTNQNKEQEPNTQCQCIGGSKEYDSIYFCPTYTDWMQYAVTAVPPAVLDKPLEDSRVGRDRIRVCMHPEFLC